MKIIILFLSLCSLGLCQTKSNSGLTVAEFGPPAFDEIVVHSTLTVKGKSGSRGAKALVNDTKPKVVPLLNTNTSSSTTTTEASTLKEIRSKRAPRRYGNGYFDQFPSSSSSSSQASSNSFNQNTPFGSFGASSSQTASQSQNFGPYGPQASAAQSASQTYRLPNGNTIDVSFSSGYSNGNGRPSFSNSHSVSLTKPNGQTYNFRG